MAYVVLCLFVSSLIMNITDKTGLVVTAWNLKTLTGARTYLNELSQLSDIMFISEHRLYKSELYKRNNLGTHFEVYGKALWCGNDVE